MAEKSKTWGLIAYGRSERSQIDLEPVRSALQEQGLSVEAKPMPGGGGTLTYTTKNGFVIDLDGGGGGRTDLSGPVSEAAGGGSGFISMGYQLRAAPWLRFYPLIGIGGGGDGVVYAPTNTASPEATFEDKNRRVTAGAGGMYMRLGLAVELALGGRFGLAFSLRFGLRILLIGAGTQRITPFAHVLAGVGKLGK